MDLAAWGNYVVPGEAFARGIDQVGDAWPRFNTFYLDEDDLSLLDFLRATTEEETEDLLTGESEEKKMSWVSHWAMLPLAFDLRPLLSSRQDPPWWVRIQYAEVIDQLRIETWENGRPRRIIRMGSEMPWVLYGEPYAWETEHWSGKQPLGEEGEFEDAQPPLTLAPEKERVDLAELLILQAGAGEVAGGGTAADYEADLGTFEFRDGRGFWHGLKPYPRATELARTVPQSSIDEDGRAWIDLENANLVPDPALADMESEEWPDVQGLFTAALENLLGLSTEDDLTAPEWTGIILTPSGKKPKGGGWHARATSPLDRS